MLSHMRLFIAHLRNSFISSCWDGHDDPWRHWSGHDHPRCVVKWPSLMASRWSWPPLFSSKVVHCLIMVATRQHISCFVFLIRVTIWTIHLKWTVQIKCSAQCKIVNTRSQSVLYTCNDHCTRFESNCLASALWFETWDLTRINISWLGFESCKLTEL